MRALLVGLFVLAPLALTTTPARAAQAPQEAQTTVTRAGLTVTYRDPTDAAQLPALFGAWGQARRDLGRLGLSLPSVRWTAARSAIDFARLTGGGAATLSALTRGQTIYSQRLGALAARGSLTLTARHEAFHAAQPPLPRWLAEGLARLFSGEAQTDPPGATRLEGLSAGALEAQLLSPDAGARNAAYREATRRARVRVSQVGWAGVLGGKSAR